MTIDEGHYSPAINLHVFTLILGVFETNFPGAKQNEMLLCEKPSK